MQDAVLRMLVDKYKPLRSGTLQSADQKLKRAPPAISSVGAYHGATDEFRGVSKEPSSPKLLQPSTGSWATESLLSSTEGHRPWHTEFRVPSHVSASVKVAHFPLQSSRPSASTHSVDELKRKKEKESKKRVEHVGRLSRARESTLDYRLGIKKSSERTGRRPNPVSLKGWASLVEDKIEVCSLSYGKAYLMLSVESPYCWRLQCRQGPRSTYGTNRRREQSIYWSRRVSHEPYSSTKWRGPSLG